MSLAVTGRSGWVPLTSLPKDTVEGDAKMWEGVGDDVERGRRIQRLVGEGGVLMHYQDS